MSQRANLRTCMFCEWVFKRSVSGDAGCPECAGPHYGARYVYGNRAYRYAQTQEPWLQRQEHKLRDYVREKTQRVTDKELTT